MLKRTYKEQGFSLIELIISMVIIGGSVLSYELISYKITYTINLLNNDKELNNLVENRFNEYVATGIMDISSSDSVDVSVLADDSFAFYKQE